MRFTAHYAGSNVCAPSRCVADVRPTHRARLHPRESRRSAKGFRTKGKSPFPRARSSSRCRSSRHGYALGGFGKWGLGPFGSTGDPLNQGFDRLFGYNCQAVAHNYYPTHLWDDDRQLPLNNPAFSAHQKLPAGADLDDPAVYAGFTGQRYAPDLIGEKALRFMRDNQDRPFFLYYPTTVPAPGLASARRLAQGVRGQVSGDSPIRAVTPICRTARRAPPMRRWSRAWIAKSAG